MEARIEILRHRESPAEAPRVALSRKGEELTLCAEAPADIDGLEIDLVLTLRDWRGGYVLVPGAVYAGNDFRVLNVPYPPIYDAEQGPETVVTDVPRLPSFNLLAGDASYPALGLWNPQTQTAHAILFPAQVDLGYVGLKVSEDEGGLEVRIQFPGVRTEGRYTMVETRSPSDDQGASITAGWTFEADLLILEREAKDVDALFALLEANRNRSVPPSEQPKLRPFSSVAALIQDATMSARWHENPGYFDTADTDRGIPFQVGWVGGGITSFPLLESKDPLAQARARRNIDFICEALQAPCGFFYGGYGHGEIVNDGFGHPHAAHWGMVRKSGDMLLFLLRHLLAEPHESWLNAAQRCADAFVKNWETTQDWGQFVDLRDGRIVVKGSACGGTALAGLALAAQLFESPAYLETARTVGDHYAKECVEKGLLTGGPGEILKAPDSESAFGLLEGYIGLWEATGEPKWLEYAEQTARQAASWVVSYDFPFPPESTFARMAMRTTGTVIANVQNKHSAPGICTLSALSLLKLYRATQDRNWLDLAVEISHALPQYVSTEERPIHAEDGRPLPAGWINERVNMSDWEAPARGLGEVYCGPCWPMASMLLTALELPSIYVDQTQNLVVCFDHVEATLENGHLQVTNPTPYEAEVTILIDEDPNRPLGELWWRNAPSVKVPSQRSAEFIGILEPGLQFGTEAKA